MRNPSIDSGVNEQFSKIEQVIFWGVPGGAVYEARKINNESNTNGFEFASNYFFSGVVDVVKTAVYVAGGIYFF